MTGSLREFLAARDAAREARTRRERHGMGELVLVNGVPTTASGCLSPDGTAVDATCLTRQEGLADAARVWMRAVVPGSPLRRRGRLCVDSGVALHFLDESGADLDAGTLSPAAPDLERDLLACQRIRDLTRGSDLFAGLLYAALCNTEWRHVASDRTWRQGWRSNGGTVASLRGGENYLDWYCWGHEGTVDEGVLAELRRLGWELLPVEGHQDPGAPRSPEHDTADPT